MGRYWVSGLVATRWGEAFPVGTLVVNATGSLLIGLIAALADPAGRVWLNPSLARHFLMLGVLGGYTTFSSFSLQTLALARDGEWLFAAVNVVGSVVACLAAVWLGHVVGQIVNR
jgi:CrcB protein